MSKEEDTLCKKHIWSPDYEHMTCLACNEVMDMSDAAKYITALEEKAAEPVGRTLECVYALQEIKDLEADLVETKDRLTMKYVHKLSEAKRALEVEIADLKKKFEDMPLVDIGFKTRKEMESWEKWRSTVFDGEGNLKEKS